MEHLARSSGCDVWFESLERPFLFRSPFQGGEFVLMLVVNDTGITPDEQIALSTLIVRQCCRYAVCAGHECSTWDDSIDLASVSIVLSNEPSDDLLVMTTWHENQPIEDVVEWFRWSTSFEDFTPKNFLVLLLGENRATESEVRQALVRFF